MVEFWVDTICWNSFLKILFTRKKGHLYKIYYLHHAKYFSLFINIIQKIGRSEFHPLDNICYAEVRVNGKSLYEQIHDQVKIHCNENSKKVLKSNFIKELIENQNINNEKIEKYFERILFDIIYRYVELTEVAKLFSSDNRKYFVFKSHPICELFVKKLNLNALHYNTLLGSMYGLKGRSEYEFDKNIKLTRYYISRILETYYLLTNWLSMLFYQSIIKNNSSDSCFIGAEILRGSVIPQDTNDIFWAQSKYIDTKNIIAIGGTHHYIDKESENYLDQQGIKKINFHGNRFIFNHMLLLLNPFCILKFLRFIIFKNYLNVLSIIKTCLYYLFQKNIETWNRINAISFLIDVYKYQGYYSYHDIKIVWSMQDGLQDCFPKSQALENINGYYAGSHWSHLPMFRLDAYNYYDIFCVWSLSCVEEFFENKCGSLSIPIGYPADYVFNNYRKKSEELRAKHNNNFIITYLDSGFGNDSPYSIKYQKEMYQLFISILKQYPFIKLIFKPKRLKVYEVLKNLLPNLSKFEDEGRILVLRNTLTRKTFQETKIPPIYPGLASDLVIGLGISSAATECYFGGTMALHADLTNFSGNKFNKTGTNKFIFKSVNDLELEIKKYINTSEQERLKLYSESKAAYYILDPFQDGQAFDRVGFILAQLLDNIRNNKSREDINQNLKETYNKHVSLKYSYYSFNC